MLSLFTPLTQAIYPFNCRKFSYSFNDGINSAKKTGIPIALLALLASVSMIVMAPFIIGYLKFPAETIFISRVLSIWLLFGVINNVFGIQILSASGQGRKYSRIVLTSALFTIFLMLLLSYQYKATGVAFAVLGGELVLSSLLFIYIYNKISR